MIIEQHLDIATRADRSDLYIMMGYGNLLSFQRTGQPMWKSAAALEELRAQVDRNEVYVSRDGKRRAVAAIALSQNPTDYWRRQGIERHALYFSKLMKDTDAGQTHVMGRMLGLAAQEALSLQLELLRADTTAHATPLLRQYERHDIHVVGEFVYRETGTPGVLLEGQAAAVLSTSRRAEL